MATDTDPVVGSWYRDVDTGERFEVVGLDEEHGLVEIQPLDADPEEIDIDAWYEREIEPIETPDESNDEAVEEEEIIFDDEEMDDDWETPLRDPDTGGRKRRGRKPRDDEFDDELEDDRGFADDDLWREEE